VGERGDPNAQDGDVHEGPYLKYQVKGAGKAGAVRIPLEGNPNMASGYTGATPPAIEEWGIAADSGPLFGGGGEVDGG
jgi:hypothetical protein